MKKSHYPIWGANLMYFIFALTLLFVGGRIQSWDFEYGMLITEYGIVLGPVIILGLLVKIDFKKALKLNRIKPLHLFIIFLIVVFSLPITLTLNLTVISILSLFDKVIMADIPTASSLKEFGVLFFIISISAGICEEAFFRGMILNTYEAHYSKKKAIIISAIFFGVFHFNIQNLFGPIFLGLLFGYLVVETNSIFAGVFAHMVNNGIAVIMAFVLNLIQSFSQAQIMQQQQEQVEMFDDPLILLGMLVFWGLASIGSSGVIYLLLKWLKKDLSKGSLESNEKNLDSEIADLDEIESKPQVAWYKQYHNIPVIGTGLLYIYYLSRHMQM